MKFYSNVLLFIIVTKLNDNEYQLGINFRGEIIFFKVVITFLKDFEMKIAKKQSYVAFILQNFIRTNLHFL